MASIYTFEQTKLQESKSTEEQGGFTVFHLVTWLYGTEHQATCLTKSVIGGTQGKTCINLQLHFYY